MSLISTYQGRKSLFAEKLISKGVSASGTDGLTTLINKIDDIQHFDSGLTLYADKSIAQSSDTVNLYALLLNNGKPVSGETVLFKGIGGVRTDTYNSDPYTVYTVFGEGKIDCAAGTWRVVQGTTHIEYTTSNVFSLENTDSELMFIFNDTKIEISGLSSIDLTEPFEIWVDSNVTSNTFSLVESATTSTNGVATFQYTCSGAGLKTITAESGSSQSEIYSIYDYINYDNGIADDYQNMWTGNTEDLTRQSDGSLFSSTSARKLLSSALISGDFEATFEAIGTDSPLWGIQDESSNMTRFYMRNDAVNYYKITRVDGTITAKYSANGTSWTNLTAQSSNVTSADCYFLFHNNSGTKSIKFKNVKIYPI